MRSHISSLLFFIAITQSVVSVKGNECGCTVDGLSQIVAGDFRNVICEGTGEKKCEYTFESTDGDNQGILVQFTVCTLGNGTVEFYDGDDTNPMRVIRQPEGCGFNLDVGPTVSSKMRIKITDSSSSTMNIEFAASPAKARTTTTQATTLPTTTKPAYHGDLPSDPAGLQLDLAVAIDTSGGKPEAYLSMQKFAIELISRMSVHTNFNDNNGVRLSLILIGAVGGGEPWIYENDSFAGTVESFPQSLHLGPFDFHKPLSKFASEGFLVTGDRASRTTAERVLLILTANDSKDTGPLREELDDLGVLPVLAYFGTTEHKNLDDMLGTGGKPFAEFEYPMNENLTENVDSFLNETLLNGDQVCAMNVEPVDISDAVEHKISSYNYLDDFSDQANKYCNLQNTRYEIFTTNHEFIKVQVWYDLEPEEDFLRITDANGKKHALFTGYGVKDSKMCIESHLLTVEFQTNEMQVYHGFKMILKGDVSCKEPW